MDMKKNEIGIKLTIHEDVIDLIGNGYYFDTIIMGRKQISGFGSIMAIGSVARKVSELSQVPVMLVYQERIEGKHPYSNILVPYDGSEH